MFNKIKIKYMEKKENKSELFTTSVIKANVMNGNDRIYTDDCIQSMLEQFLESKNKIGGMLGEIGFRQEPMVSLNNASHLVENMYKVDDTLYAEIKFLDTENGKKARELLETGQFVVRSRSFGTVNEDKTVNIENVISYDIIPKSEDSFKDIL
jgi:hypothetical protein